MAQIKFGSSTGLFKKIYFIITIGAAAVSLVALLLIISSADGIRFVPVPLIAAAVTLITEVIGRIAGHITGKKVMLYAAIYSVLAICCIIFAAFSIICLW